MSVIVKIVFEDDIRRISLRAKDPFESLLEEVQRIYTGKFSGGVQVRYVDDENDRVTVTSDMELQEALEVSDHTLKLYISPKIAGEGELELAEYVKITDPDNTRCVVVGSDTESKDDGLSISIVDSVTLADPVEAKHATDENVAFAPTKSDDTTETVQSKDVPVSGGQKEKEPAPVVIPEKQELPALDKQEKNAKGNDKKTVAKKLLKEAKQEAKKAEKVAKKAAKEAKKALKALKQQEKDLKKKKKFEKEEAKKLASKLRAEFVADVTIPDGTELEFGSPIVKTWRVKNNGKIAWPTGVSLEKHGKGAMKPVSDRKIPALKPGEEADISVDLIVPTKRGKFQTPNFRLAYQGFPFGDNFWAIIKAVPVKKTEARKAPAAQKEQKMAPAPVKQDAKKPKKNPLGAHFVKDLTFPDDVVVAPGQAIRKAWLIKNTGEVAWPVGTKLVSIVGSTFGQDAETVLKVQVKKGEQFKLTVDLVAPAETGKFTSRFQLVSPEGEKFGHKYWINVQVSKFPNRDQLKTMWNEFLADEKVVEALQAEFPTIIQEIRQGKKLASIVDVLLKNRPELKKHQFVIFIQPFLQSAETFMGMQLDALVSMYSFWAMTPFCNGAKGQAVSKDDVKSKGIESQKSKGCKLVPKKDLKSNKVQEKAPLPADEAKCNKLTKPMPAFKYAKELETFKEMGFKNIDHVKALLLEYKGDSQRVFADLFGQN